MHLVEVSEKAKEARKEYMREWRKKNMSHVNAYARRWRKNNPEKVAAMAARYWEKKAEQAERGTEKR